MSENVYNLLQFKEFSPAVLLGKLEGHPRVPGAQQPRARASSPARAGGLCPRHPAVPAPASAPPLLHGVETRGRLLSVRGLTQSCIFGVFFNPYKNCSKQFTCSVAECLKIPCVQTSSMKPYT